MPFPFKRLSPETLIEKVAVAMILRQLGPASTLPVLRSDETVATDDFRAIVVGPVTAEASPVVIDEADVRASCRSYEVPVVLRGLSFKGEADAESTAWNDVEEALRSLDPTGLPLNDFLSFHVFAESASKSEVDEEGRKEKTRTYRIAAELSPLG